MNERPHSLPTETVTIDRIIAGGDGMGRLPDGRVVFVPRTAPGERVVVEIVKSHKQWARGHAVEIEVAGPARVEPPCPYYNTCGGCQLQHLTYDAQLAAKASIVTDALRRLGGVEVEEPYVVASPDRIEYRNRISLVLRRESGEVHAGFHAYDEPDEVVDVERCLLAEPAIQGVWTGLRSAWGERAERLPAGRQLRLTLRASADGRVGLAIEDGFGYGDIGGLAGDVETLDAAWCMGSRDEIEWGTGPRTISETWGDYEIPLAGKAFVQVNRGAAELLDAYTIAQCESLMNARIVDAYCGFGVRALELARAGANVVGIDFNRNAVAVANDMAGERSLTARFVAARVERALARELPVQTCVLNPPRGGLDKQVVEALLANPPRRLVYVSCDPATLARDVKRLSETFSVSAVRCFDLFPQTAQVETVLTLTR